MDALALPVQSQGEIHFMGMNPPVEVLRQENGSLVLIGAVWVWSWILLGHTA